MTKAQHIHHSSLGIAKIKQYSFNIGYCTMLLFISYPVSLFSGMREKRGTNFAALGPIDTVVGLSRPLFGLSAGIWPPMVVRLKDLED
jgi:hypothetical protein